MTVDAKQTKAMEDILAAMNGIEQQEVMIGQPEPIEDDAQPIRVAVVSEGQQAMKDILGKIYSSVDPSMDVLSTEAVPVGDPELKAALVTERTQTGSRIGDWEIVKRDNADYDVVSAQSSRPIAKGLKLYEAAVALGKALNAGKSITDNSVQQILALEAKYAAHLGKATHHRHMAKKLTESGNPVRAAVAEDRFDVAKDFALEERERMRKLAGLNR